MISDVLKSIREDAHMSRADLSNQMGISECSLTNVESGNANFGESQILKAAEILKLDTNILFTIKKNQIAQADENLKIGKEIKRLRKSKNMTQTQLAAELGYASSGQICFIEKGKRGMSKRKLIKFCNLFQVNIAEMFDPLERDQVIVDFMDLYHSEEQSELFEIIKNIISIAASRLSN